MVRHIATIVVGVLIAAFGQVFLVDEPTTLSVVLARVSRGVGLVVALVGVVAIGVRSGMKGLLNTEWANELFTPPSSAPVGRSNQLQALPPLERDVAGWLRTNPASGVDRIQAGTGHVQQAVQQALDGLKAKGLLVEHYDGRFSLR